MSEDINHHQSPPAVGLLDLPAALPFIIDEIPLGIAVMDYRAARGPAQPRHGSADRI